MSQNRYQLDDFDKKLDAIKSINKMIEGGSEYSPTKWKEYDSFVLQNVKKTFLAVQSSLVIQYGNNPEIIANYPLYFEAVKLAQHILVRLVKN